MYTEKKMLSRHPHNDNNNYTTAVVKRRDVISYEKCWTFLT